MSIYVILRPPPPAPFQLAYIFWWTMAPGGHLGASDLFFWKCKLWKDSSPHSSQIGSALRNRPQSPGGSWHGLWKLMKKEGRQGTGRPGSLGYLCTQKDLDTSCGIIFLIFCLWWSDSILNTQSARFLTNFPELLLGIPWAVLFEGTNGIRRIARCG